MKLAVIAPPQAQGIVFTMRMSFHLVLAQYLEDVHYQDFYATAHRRGDFIMLDNGAGEGVQMTMKDLLEAADAVQADEITMPDVIGDADATIVAVQKNTQFVPKWQRAVCPHGSNWGEWERCAEKLISFGVATICVGRYDNLPGGRIPALEIIVKNRWQWTHHIHMFGCAEPPIAATHRELRCAPFIRSMDSGAPIAYAQEGRLLDEGPHVSLDWKAGVNDRYAERNVALLASACNGV